MSSDIKIDVEAWFDHTVIEVEHEHPGSGEQFHVFVKVATDHDPTYNIVIQFDETKARILRDKLTATLEACWTAHKEASS